MSVYILATLDTKGREAEYVCQVLREARVEVKLVDTGCIGQPQVAADVSRDQLFEAAGTTLQQMTERGDRGEAVSRAADGAIKVVSDAHQAGQLLGVMALGGSAGTTIGTAAMRALPLGVPKVMVSTLASGDVRNFVGVRDIMMVNSVVDILGLNRISRTVLGEAAAAMAGMVKFAPPPAEHTDKPLVAATMFGVTTTCVQRAREVLEAAGYEVLVFHATGTGGQAMEELIRDGLIAGVLDITTTELADELVGGVLSAGPDRLTAAAVEGIPQVVSVGATDMVNFWALDTVPAQFKDRQLYKHNENVTLMRTTARECEEIGTELAAKVSRAQGPSVVILPTLGVSAIDKEGQPFDDPSARASLFEAIRAGCEAEKLIELPQHINDPEFAEAAANKLIEMIRVARHSVS
ncbi:Tm-1-like ATP-binding domain-containing protein [Acidobacteria bacterium AH-259-A15]|nr:Tm-1-like ATP-binding domain-containing protein [Acidobacteria bacterium AH-259-A15]